MTVPYDLEPVFGNVMQFKLTVAVKLTPISVLLVIAEDFLYLRGARPLSV